MVVEVKRRSESWVEACSSASVWGFGELSRATVDAMIEVAVAPLKIFGEKLW